MKVASLTVVMAVLCVGNAMAAAPSSSDSRKIFGVDPRVTFKSHPKYKAMLQVGNSIPEITTVPEPGWWDSRSSQHLVLRTSDPTNGSKKAFRHRLQKGMTYKGGTTARAEAHASWGSSATLQLGVPYWAAYAFYVDKDHPFNGSGDDLNILELGHPVKSKNSLPSPAFFLRKNGTWDAMLSSNKVLNGGTSTRKTTKVFSQSIQKGVWHYVIVQLKLHWDPSKGPYFRVWRATGGGSPVQIASSNLPNNYNESVTYSPQKFGLYMWNVSSGWGTSNSRTLYTKGLHVFKDVSGSPALNVGSMLEFIRGI